MSKSLIKGLILVMVSLVILGALFILILGVGIYKYNWRNSFTEKALEIIPYPAALISGKIVTYNDWQNKVKQYQSNKNLYLTEQAVDLSSLPLPSKKELKQKALDDLIKRALLYKLANKNKIKISDEEIEIAYHDSVLANIKNGEEAAEESLEKMYGLSIKELKQEIIYDYLLRKKLTEKLASNPNDELDALAKEEASALLQEIADGADFTNLARQESDDSLSLRGGEMGYIGRGEMLAFYEDAAWTLSVGEVSDLIKTPEHYAPAGYYIIKLEDKRTLDREEEIKIQHIFIAANIDKWIEKQLQEANIKRFVRID